MEGKTSSFFELEGEIQNQNNPNMQIRLPSKIPKTKLFLITNPKS